MRVRFTGSHLSIETGGALVVDQEFPFAPHAGAYGLAAFNDAVTGFDDICARGL